MKKLLLICISVLAFAKISVIDKKITKDSIIVTFETDNKTFETLKNNTSQVEKNTHTIACKNPLVKELIKKYNLIYKYEYNHNVVKVEIRKNSCE